jgi:hypothetical protein
MKFSYLSLYRHAIACILFYSLLQQQNIKNGKTRNSYKMLKQNLEEDYSDCNS